MTNQCKKKIAVIFHENERKRTGNYVVAYLAELWREEGLDVAFVFGTQEFVPAEIAILHLNLSVVPEEYIEFARQYPIVINEKVTDIRKSAFSKNLVHPGDDYDGKVIVKSDLNYAGTPERSLNDRLIPALLSRFERWLGVIRFAGKPIRPHFHSPLDYLILDDYRQIPRNWFERKDIVVEKFLPEMDDGLYCIRNYNFLGDRSTCVLRKGTHPIVNSSTATSMTPIEVHPEIMELRRKLNFDYGKFDYLIHDGIPLLLDINKTPGASTSIPAYLPMRRQWASGIYSYFS
jgi:hypothetical protein